MPIKDVLEGNFAIQPCYLVIDKLSVDRKVTYVKYNYQEESTETAHWETERKYISKSETDEANKAYSNARSKLRSVCVRTPIGWVCPISHQNELKKAIEDARKIVNDANAKLQHCSVTFRVVTTVLEPTNLEGVEILKESLAKLHQDLKEAVKAADLQKARTLATSIKHFGRVASDPATKMAIVGFQADVKTTLSYLASVLKSFDDDASAVATHARDDLFQRTEDW